MYVNVTLVGFCVSDEEQKNLRNLLRPVPATREGIEEREKSKCLSLHRFNLNVQKHYVTSAVVTFSHLWTAMSFQMSLGTNEGTFWDEGWTL